MENQLALTPKEDQAAIELYNQGLRLRELAEGRIIAGTLQAQDATNDLAIIAKLKKALEAKGKEYTDPIKANLKVIQEVIKELLTPFEEADVINRQKWGAWNAAEKAKQAEVERINNLRMEAARAEAELNNGEITESPTQIPVPYVAPTTKSAMGTVGTMKVWQWECVNQSAVPEEYKLLDSARIRKVISAGGSIPGIKSWQEETVKVTTR